MGKGVLLEKEGRKAVVLTSTGQFKRVLLPTGTCSVGDEIAFDENEMSRWRRWAPVAAAALLMLMVAPMGYQQWALAEPTAILTVDINPSLSFTLNRRDEVLAADALNADGATVLSGVNWKRRPIDEVLSALTGRAIDEGKLSPGDATSAVVVAVAPARKEELVAQQSATLLAKARGAVSAKVAERAHATKTEPRTSVAALEATVKDRDEAKSVGLTPGKFLLLKEIQERLPEVTAEQLRDEGPGRLLKRYNLNPSDLFRAAESRHSPARGAGKGKATPPEKAEPPEQQESAKGESSKKQEEKKQEEKKPDGKKESDKRPAEKKGADKNEKREQVVNPRGKP